MLAGAAVRLSARAVGVASCVAPRLASAVGPASVGGGLAARGYHQNIVDHYENPRNVGACTARGAAPPLGRGSRRTPARRVAAGRRPLLPLAPRAWPAPPPSAGSLDKNAKDVGTGLVGAPACGDVMKLQVRRQPRWPPDAPPLPHRRTHRRRDALATRLTRPPPPRPPSHPQIKVGDDGKIIDAKFKTFGCGSAIASRCVSSSSSRPCRSPHPPAWAG